MIEVKKLSLPLLTVIPLLFSAVTIGGSYASTRAALEEHAKTEKEILKKSEEHDKRLDKKDVQSAVLETKMDTVIKSLERLENRFGTAPQ